MPSQGSWYAKAGTTAGEMASLNTTLTGQGFYQYAWWYCDASRSAIWRK